MEAGEDVRSRSSGGAGAGARAAIDSAPGLARIAAGAWLRTALPAT